MAGEVRDSGGGEPFLSVAAGPQDDGGADFVAFFFGFLDQVASVGVADPADRGAAVHGAGQHFDLVGDEESGEQPDSELAEEFVAGVAELVAFAGPADSGEEFVDLRFGQAHPGVVDPQAAFTGVFGGLDVDPGGGVRLFGAPRGHGVDTVLQQFAQVDAGTGV